MSLVAVLKKNVYLTPAGGRSSDNTAFPFFNIEMPGEQGIMVAIGWSGKWYADVLQDTGNSIYLRSGIERMKLFLFPGEEIRTPEISLLFWKESDRMKGHNQFRKFILAHHSRKINGRLAEYPLSGSFDYGDPAPCGEYECLTEEYAIALIKRYQGFKILPELFWLDAGWYTGCGGDKENGRWWQNVGNWSVDKERFPNGLKAISDAVWLAYQLNRPDQRDGIILAFRRSGNNEETIRVKLSGLEDNTIYEVNYEDYGVIIRKSGHELMEGFDITIPLKPSSLMISYESV